MIETLKVETTEKRQIIEITQLVQEKIDSLEVDSGLCTLFIHHTTAALTTGEVGEGTDEDLLETLEKMIPQINFRHLHNPQHAPDHMIGSILGPCLSVPIKDGKLSLGHWQRLLLVELCGPRTREISLYLSS